MQRLERRRDVVAAERLHRIGVIVHHEMRLHVDAKVAEILNVGTHADPVASMLLTLDWRVATPIKEDRGGASYHVTGVGGFKDLSFDPRLARRDARGLPALAGALKALDAAP